MSKCCIEKPNIELGFVISMLMIPRYANMEFTVHLPIQSKNY